MASDHNPTKTIETTKADGGKEVKVCTVDHRSPAGQGQQEVSTEAVEVIHEIPPGGGASSGAFSAATEAVANTIQSAKDAISGTK